MTPTRRQFLVAGAGAAAGGAALLAACSDDSSSSPPTNPGDTAVPALRADSTELPKAFAMVQRFPNHPLFIPGQEARLPISIMKVASNDQNGGLRDNGPETIEGWIEGGVSRVILGTVAVKDPALVKAAASAWPEQIAVAIVTPADGPSLGIAPAGTWMWRSFFWKYSSSTPSSRA